MRIRLTLMIAGALLLAAGLALAQTPASLSFEVASVKPAALDINKLAAQAQATGQIPKIGPHVDKARAEYIFMTLKELITTAYRVKSSQISGPDWLNNNADAQRFDIVAKMPDGATVAQAPDMLQTLLAERFKLKLHRETKEHPVMALELGKDGAKLKEAPPVTGQDFDENTPLKPGETQLNTSQGPVRVTIDPKIGGTVTNMGNRGVWTQQVQPGGTFHLEGKSTTMSAFADVMTNLSQRTGGAGMQVVDMTGLQGHYNVVIDFSLAGETPGAVGGPVAASDPGASSSLADAVKALGLKLESRKAPIEQLVIDNAEKTPTTN